MKEIANQYKNVTYKYVIDVIDLDKKITRVFV